MPERDPALDAAYRATSYFVDGPAGWFTIRIGRPSPEADALAAAHGAECWAFVTAYNPGSVQTSPQSNATRQGELVKSIEDAEYMFYRGEGKGDDGRWPAEPSLLVLGITRDEARRLAGRFGQAAFVFGERGGPARLVWTEAERPSPPG